MIIWYCPKKCVCIRGIKKGTYHPWPIPKSLYLCGALNHKTRTNNGIYKGTNFFTNMQACGEEKWSSRHFWVYFGVDDGTPINTVSSPLLFPYCFTIFRTHSMKYTLFQLQRESTFGLRYCTQLQHFLLWLKKNSLTCSCPTSQVGWHWSRTWSR